MSSPKQNETLDARPERPSPPSDVERRLYLLVLEGDSSSLCPLPRNGTLLVGRASTADIQVQDPSVSRNHARLEVAEGKVRLTDLGSHNGVRVNGEQVTGTRPLRSGDVVTLGDVALILHSGDKPQPARAPLEAETLRDRLAEELERVLRYERSASVVALEPGPTTASLEELVRAAGNSLRLMDLIGQCGPTQLLVLLPEMEAEEAEDASHHLLETLSTLAPRARAGVASAPQDGLDADAIIAAARAAALAAPDGGSRASGPALHRLDLGERSSVVADAAMVRLYELLRRLAHSPIPVLIHGETGTGKENAAWAVHYWSPRSTRPFVALNCAALPESLVESELFGYEKGAFSGAAAPRAGLLERASGGTLFLDEVAELPLSVQAKLLRALDQKRITRLGDSRERAVDLRIVAATHRVLTDEVKAGRFRQDLFFRLSAAVVLLPPLRERSRELPLLANTFLAEACARTGQPPPRISASAMQVLSAHVWPGNVRELRNVIEYASTASGSILDPSHLPDYLRGSEAAPPLVTSTEPSAVSHDFRPIAEELRDLERQRMLEALAATGGVQTRAALLLGMPVRTFVFKLKKYGLSSRKVTQE